MSDATTADKLFPGFQHCTGYQLEVNKPSSEPGRIWIPGYGHIMGETAGLFVVWCVLCNALSVLGSIFYLTQMARCLSLLSLPTLSSLMQASYCLTVSLALIIPCSHHIHGHLALTDVWSMLVSPVSQLTGPLPSLITLLCCMNPQK